MRWQAGITWEQWDKVGLNYDSSLGFVDQVGFRSGVCFEYQTFSLSEHRSLSVIERPLLVMDCGLLEHTSLSQSALLEKMINLAKICKRYQGDLTILWHNSELITSRERCFYQQVLSTVIGV